MTTDNTTYEHPDIELMSLVPEAINTPGLFQAMMATRLKLNNK